MAEACIVCLGNLRVSSDDHISAVDPLSEVNSLKSSRPISAAEPVSERNVVEVDDCYGNFEKISNCEKNFSNNKCRGSLVKDSPLQSDNETIAHLIPCKHALHDSCLKPWVDRANSCPICRATFNTVNLSNFLNGPIIASYTVKNKQQRVADDQLNSSLGRFRRASSSVDRCVICDDYGVDLVVCLGCSHMWHVFCAGLDEYPVDPWFCHTCRNHNLNLLNGHHTPPSSLSVSSSVRRRSARLRRHGSSLAWERVWRSVFTRLDLDLDFPFNDHDQSSSPSTVELDSRNRWQLRLLLASQRNSNGRSVSSTVNLTNETSSQSRRPADPESQDEIRAWNAFDKARLLEQKVIEDGNTQAPTSSNLDTCLRQKRQSSGSSPSTDSSTGPAERKLKRPRTRRTLDHNTGYSQTSSSTPRWAESVQCENDAGVSDPSNPTLTMQSHPLVLRNRHTINTSPSQNELSAGVAESLDNDDSCSSFLRSLLQEVESVPATYINDSASPSSQYGPQKYSSNIPLNSIAGSPIFSTSTNPGFLSTSSLSAKSSFSSSPSTTTTTPSRGLSPVPMMVSPGGGFASCGKGGGSTNSHSSQELSGSSSISPSTITASAGDNKIPPYSPTFARPSSPIPLASIVSPVFPRAPDLVSGSADLTLLNDKNLGKMRKLRHKKMRLTLRD